MSRQHPLPMVSKPQITKKMPWPRTLLFLQAIWFSERGRVEQGLEAVQGKQEKGKTPFYPQTLSLRAHGRAIVGNGKRPNSSGWKPLTLDSTN